MRLSSQARCNRRPRSSTSSGSNRFAIDSPLEGAGFEPSVPLEVLTVGIVPCRLRGPFHASLPKTKFAADSALEGSGFEPSVPLPRLSSIRAVRAEIIGRSTDVFRRDREFDVSALQGRLSTSSQSQCSTDPGLIAGTWHRPLFLTRDRWFESGSLQRRVGRTPNPAAAEHQ